MEQIQFRNYFIFINAFGISLNLIHVYADNVLTILFLMKNPLHDMRIYSTWPKNVVQQNLEYVWKNIFIHKFLFLWSKSYKSQKNAMEFFH